MEPTDTPREREVWYALIDVHRPPPPADSENPWECALVWLLASATSEADALRRFRDFIVDDLGGDMVEVIDIDDWPDDMEFDVEGTELSEDNMNHARWWAETSGEVAWPYTFSYPREDQREAPDGRSSTASGDE